MSTELVAESSGGPIDWAERGWLPDRLIRAGIRRLCRERLQEEGRSDLELQDRRARTFIASLRQSPLAVEVDKANEQHYEVPPQFFQYCLGHRLKYSSCYYPTGNESLDDAEDAMLELSAARAELADGQQILELGCGWGSLTLWMAERFPNARILAISNSRPQREFIMAQAAARGLDRVEVLTQDVNHFDTERRFDRVVSIEMFEHLRNYQRLFERIAGWLNPGGKLFAHVFCHQTYAYPFETEGESNWMGRHFFTGGLMPAFDTFLHFQDHLRLEDRWRLSGVHYQRTSEHWLERLDLHRGLAQSLFEREHSRADAQRMVQRWRMFYMACAELFGYDGGREWLVGHYRFARRA